MERFGDLLFDIWREACRHIELAESVDTIAALLAPRIPIDQLLIQRIDRDRLRVEALAVGFPGPLGRTTARRVEWSEERMAALLRWCGRRAVALRRVDEQGSDIPFEAVPADLAHDVLVAPLALHDQGFGLLILHARPGERFEERHERLCGALIEPIAVALENDRRLRELRSLREAAEAERRSLLARLGRRELVESIVGLEGGLQPVMERVELVSRSDVPVLIFGETGSGKEVIARAIHVRSARAEGPFIRVNCGAIPPGLIDSELFGHEKGSFTGAVSTRHGWFERADGGTLLLDEIGELPLEAQVRLLRVLQEGSFERVGGERSRRVDVRIVASTHRDLAAMVQNREFREDLWYRIAVFPIVLPPLRERREDIPSLAEYLAERAARRFGLRPQRPTKEQIALLASYDWPGNVRELMTVMDRAAILGDGASLEVAKALGVEGGAPQVKRDRQRRGPAFSAGEREVVPLDEAMKRHIEAALAATAGRIEGPRGAAALLAINPHTLRARMRKLEIDWARFRSVD